MCKWGKEKKVTLKNKKRVKVDECIARLVQALNDYGIETIASCCGRGKTAKSSIKIKAQNVRLIPLGDDLTVHLEFPYKNA